MKCAIKIIACALAAVAVSGCGFSNVAALIQGTGTSGKSASQNVVAALSPLHGHIVSGAPELSDLTGWYVFASQKDGSGGRLAEVDAGGQFTLLQLDRDKFWTINVFNTEPRMVAVLSMPSAPQRTVAQYFTTNESHLPQLILTGNVVRFVETASLVIGREIASDLDGNGVPDGMEGTTVGGLPIPGGNFSLSHAIDTDLDGIPNIMDTDIDGDGVINLFDPDDDGDGILDIFDTDADGNLVSDVIDAVYGEFLNDRLIRRLQGQFSSRVAIPTAGLSEQVNSLRLSVESRYDSASLYEPNLFVSVLGAYDLLAGSAVLQDGQLVAFDRTLHDERDGIFSRDIILAGNKHPQANLTLFIHVENSRGDVIGDYPFTFAPISPSDATISYDAPTRTILLAGEPFSGNNSFVWSAVVSAPGGEVEFTSAIVPGNERAFALPPDVQTLGRRLSASVMSLPKVFGQPMYVLRTAGASLE